VERVKLRKKVEREKGGGKTRNEVEREEGRGKNQGSK
jgi:hypothetical protein